MRAIESRQTERAADVQGTFDSMGQLAERLGRIEATLKSLVLQRTVREWYPTAEVAALVGKAEYTVREWCRQGRVSAVKACNGRGWLISHEELCRIRNGERPLPIPKHELDRVVNGRGK